MTVDQAKANLNDKQIAFCEHYAATLNATQAAIDAGYATGKAAKIKAKKQIFPFTPNSLWDVL